MPSLEDLAELIAAWRSEVNPGCHYCAKQLEELLNSCDEKETE
jgi:hypothetical protein